MPGTPCHSGTRANAKPSGNLAERGAPRHATSLLLIQKLPWSMDLTLAGYWQDTSKWSVRRAEKYFRFDAGKPTPSISRAGGKARSPMLANH